MSNAWAMVPDVSIENAWALLVGKPAALRGLGQIVLLLVDLCQQARRSPSRSTSISGRDAGASTRKSGAFGSRVICQGSCRGPRKPACWPGQTSGPSIRNVGRLMPPGMPSCAGRR